MIRDSKTVERDVAKKKKIFETIDKINKKITQRQRAKSEQRQLEINQKIHDLLEKKSNLSNQPVDEQEFLDAAKKQIKLNKAEVMRYLTEFLSECHKKNMTPFPMDMEIFPTAHVENILYLTLTDKDLEAMVSSLSLKGMPTKKALAKIKKIDDEIDRLHNALKEELKSIGSSLPSSETEKEKPSEPSLSSSKQAPTDETDETFKGYEGTNKHVGGVLQVEETTFK